MNRIRSYTHTAAASKATQNYQLTRACPSWLGIPEPSFPPAPIPRQEQAAWCRQRGFGMRGGLLAAALLLEGVGRVLEGLVTGKRWIMGVWVGDYLLCRERFFTPLFRSPSKRETLILRNSRIPDKKRDTRHFCMGVGAFDTKMQ